MGDAEGLFTERSFDVTVEDTTAPTFSIDNQTIEAGEYTTYDWTTEIYNIIENTDEGTVSVEVTDNVDYNTTGDYSVTVRVTDAEGLFTEESMTVTVEDTTDPTFDVILNQTIEAGGANQDWTSLITNVNDNADNGTSNSEFEDNVDYDTRGTYSVTVRVTDDAGNTADRTFNVTVEDTTAPTFDAIADQTIEAGIANQDWTGLITNIVENTDEGTVSIETPDGVDYDTRGTYTVIVRVTDAEGLFTERSFDVTVEDTTAPTFSIDNQTIDAGEYTTYDWTTEIYAIIE